MRVLIKEKGKTVFNLWLPSGPAVIRFALRFVRQDDGKRLDPDLRRKIVDIYKAIRKDHRGLVLADIQAKDGTHVFIRL